MKRNPWIAAAALLGLGLLLIVAWRSSRPGPRELAVRHRYGLLASAVQRGDTNAIVALLLPGVRTNADGVIGRLSYFARPLDNGSAVTVDGTRAVICPRREVRLPFIRNLGHTLEMTNWNGEWYYTGRLSIW